jgi:hypothetical protein
MSKWTSPEAYRPRPQDLLRRAFDDRRVAEETLVDLQRQWREAAAQIDIDRKRRGLRPL